MSEITCQYFGERFAMFFFFGYSNWHSFPQSWLKVVDNETEKEFLRKNRLEARHRNFPDWKGCTKCSFHRLQREFFIGEGVMSRAPCNLSWQSVHWGAATNGGSNPMILTWRQIVTCTIKYHAASIIPVPILPERGKKMNERTPLGSSCS